LSSSTLTLPQREQHRRPSTAAADATSPTAPRSPWARTRHDLVIWLVLSALFAVAVPFWLALLGGHLPLVWSATTVGISMVLIAWFLGALGIDAVEQAGPGTGRFVAAAAVSAACQLVAQRVARFSALTEEAHLRRLTLAHLLGLGPARAADVRSGATASLLTDGAERVALYRQTFLAPTLAAAAAPLLVLIELAAFVDVVPALVLAAAVIVVPVFIAWCHSRLRASRYRRAFSTATAAAWARVRTASASERVKPPGLSHR